MEELGLLINVRKVNINPVDSLSVTLTPLWIVAMHSVITLFLIDTLFCRLRDFMQGITISDLVQEIPLDKVPGDISDISGNIS